MYKSVLCHLHSTFEGPASISGFCYEAAKYGIDAIWLSDHDIFMPGVKGFDQVFTKYNFDDLQPLVQRNEAGKRKMACLEEAANTEPDFWQAVAATDNSGTVVRTRSDAQTWRGISLRLRVRSQYERRPLIAYPTILIDLETDITAESADTRLVLRLNLSQMPPEHKAASLQYVLGGGKLGDGELLLELRDGQARLNLAEDAMRLGLGLDHAFRNIEFQLESRNGQTAEVLLKKLQIQIAMADTYENRRAQAELGREIGRKYGVAVLVGCEISAGKEHRTCYGVDVPFFPYEDFTETPTQEEINSFVEMHGGITSVNHPFSLSGAQSATPEVRRQILEDKITELIAHKAYGSKLIEIGFPNGRQGYNHAEYLYLWDQLNLAGLHLYGIGVSDAHSNMTWDKGNNYANFIASPDCTAANFVAGMKSGNMYMADPHRFHGTICFTTDAGKTMGQTEFGGYATVALTDVPAGAELSWVIDGERAAGERVEGDCESRCCIDNARSFVRAELRDTEGRVILLTNPIWIKLNRNNGCI